MSKLAQTPRILADDLLWLLWARSLPPPQPALFTQRKGHSAEAQHSPETSRTFQKKWRCATPLSCSLCSPGPQRLPPTGQVPCLFCTEEWPGRRSLALPTAEHRGGTAGVTRSAAAAPPAHCEVLPSPMVYHEPGALLTASTDL